MYFNVTVQNCMYLFQSCYNHYNGNNIVNLLVNIFITSQFMPYDLMSSESYGNTLSYF